MHPDAYHIALTAPSANPRSNVPASLNGESLASLAPRIISLAHQASVHAYKLEASFGISREESSSEQPPTAQNLMAYMLEMERHLIATNFALENVLLHVNG